MPTEKAKPQCKDKDCDAFFPSEIKDIFVSKQELKQYGWIEIDGDIYCPKCALWNLGQQLGNLLRFQKDD